MHPQTTTMMARFLPLGLAATLFSSIEAADDATSRSVTSRLMVHVS